LCSPHQATFASSRSSQVRGPPSTSDELLAIPSGITIKQPQPAARNRRIVPLCWNTRSPRRTSSWKIRCHISFLVPSGTGRAATPARLHGKGRCRDLRPRRRAVWTASHTDRRSPPVLSPTRRYAPNAASTPATLPVPVPGLLPRRQYSQTCAFSAWTLTTRITGLVLALAISSSG